MMTKKIEIFLCFKSSSDFQHDSKVLTDFSDYLKTSGGFKQLFVGTLLVRTLWGRNPTLAAIEPLKSRHSDPPTVVLKELPCMLQPHRNTDMLLPDFS